MKDGTAGLGRFYRGLAEHACLCVECKALQNHLRKTNAGHYIEDDDIDRILTVRTL
jgi:hypothetical protein